MRFHYPATNGESEPKERGESLKKRAPRPKHPGQNKRKRVQSLHAHNVFVSEHKQAAIVWAKGTGGTPEEASVWTKGPGPKDLNTRPKLTMFLFQNTNQRQLSGPKA